MRDEASVDHTTEEIVLDALRIAKEDSKGPFFLVCFQRSITIKLHSQSGQINT